MTKSTAWTDDDRRRYVSLERETDGAAAHAVDVDGKLLIAQWMAETEEARKRIWAELGEFLYGTAGE